jgi:hypothetical protein
MSITFGGGLKAEESDMPLLGVRTLEGFSVMVDNIGHRFVATTSLVCNMATALVKAELNV